MGLGLALLGGGLLLSGAARAGGSATSSDARLVQGHRGRRRPPGSSPSPFTARWTSTCGSPRTPPSPPLLVAVAAGTAGVKPRPLSRARAALLALAARGTPRGVGTPAPGRGGRPPTRRDPAGRGCHHPGIAGAAPGPRRCRAGPPAQGPSGARRVLAAAGRHPLGGGRRCRCSGARSPRGDPRSGEAGPEGSRRAAAGGGAALTGTGASASVGSAPEMTGPEERMALDHCPRSWQGDRRPSGVHRGHSRRVRRQGRGASTPARRGEHGVARAPRRGEPPREPGWMPEPWQGEAEGEDAPGRPTTTPRKSRTPATASREGKARTTWKRRRRLARPTPLPGRTMARKRSPSETSPEPTSRRSRRPSPNPRGTRGSRPSRRRSVPCGPRWPGSRRSLEEPTASRERMAQEVEALADHDPAHRAGQRAPFRGPSLGGHRSRPALQAEARRRPARNRPLREDQREARAQPRGRRAQERGPRPREHPAPGRHHRPASVATCSPFSSRA